MEIEHGTGIKIDSVCKFIDSWLSVDLGDKNVFTAIKSSLSGRISLNTDFWPKNVKKIKQNRAQNTAISCANIYKKKNKIKSNVMKISMKNSLNSTEKQNFSHEQKGATKIRIVSFFELTDSN